MSSTLLTIIGGLFMIAANIVGVARDDKKMNEMIDEKLEERFKSSDEKGGD